MFLFLLSLSFATNSEPLYITNPDENLSDGVQTLFVISDSYDHYTGSYAYAALLNDLTKWMHSIAQKITDDLEKVFLDTTFTNPHFERNTSVNISFGSPFPIRSVVTRTNYSVILNNTQKFTLPISVIVVAPFKNETKQNITLTWANVSEIFEEGNFMIYLSDKQSIKYDNSLDPILPISFSSKDTILESFEKQTAKHPPVSVPEPKYWIYFVVGSVVLAIILAVLIVISKDKSQQVSQPVPDRRSKSRSSRSSRSRSPKAPPPAALSPQKNE